MSILVTICARGGSKGVKDKNIRLLAGKPLIAHTIDQAKLWGKADAIVCSTDSKKIQEIAREYGALVLFTRPPELSTDAAAKLPVIRHALQESERILGRTFDIVLDLDVTNPIRTAKDIDAALNIFLEKNCPVLYSVVESKKNPYFNMFEINKQGYATVCKKSTQEIFRRQDAPPVYIVNANIYYYKRSFVLNPSSSLLFEEKVAAYMMSEYSAIDIDSETDFKIVELLIKEKVVNL